MREALPNGVDHDTPGSSPRHDRSILRYRYPSGEVQAVLPLALVERTADRVVGWTPPGSDILYWATSDGRDPRTVPLEERFTQPLTTAPRKWTGHVLRVIPLRRHFQVLHFFNADWTFTGWYINLETPKIVRGEFLDTVDLHLDFVISPDGERSWKDEDEAAAALAAGQLDASALASSRIEVEELLSRLDSWPAPIGDWRRFVPPPTEPLRLKDNWGTALDSPRSLTPDEAVASVNRALADDDHDFALRMILQARDDLRSTDVVTRARGWHHRDDVISDLRFDTLFRAIVAHELGDDAPSWANAKRLDEDWVIPDPFRTTERIMAQTPAWLAVVGIFTAERGLDTA